MVVKIAGEYIRERERERERHIHTPPQNTQRLDHVLLSAQEEKSALIEGKMTCTE